MERKPWPIIILALIHILEPVFKIGFYSAYWNIPILRYVNYLVHLNTSWEHFLFFAAFPIAGLSILAVKAWSLPVFLLMQAITLSAHAYHHHIAPQTFSLSLVVFMSTMNLAVVTYFLLPAVRLAYLDPSVRWWEALPRFVVDWKAKLSGGNQTKEVLLGNISRGGAFVHARGGVDLKVNANVEIEFSFLNSPMKLKGVVRHVSHDAGTSRVGIEFCELTRVQKKALRLGTKQLKELHYTPQRIQDDTFVSFKNWAQTLSKTGKGLFPEKSERRTSVKSDTADKSKKAS